jgi:hypothetical protein
MGAAKGSVSRKACPEQCRRERKRRQEQISKHEIRNSIQNQMIERHKIQNILDSDSVFWLFRVSDFFVLEFVSDSDIRILDFDWSLLGVLARANLRFARVSVSITVQPHARGASALMSLTTSTTAGRFAAKACSSACLNSLGRSTRTAKQPIASATFARLMSSKTHIS